MKSKYNSHITNNYNWWNGRTTSKYIAKIIWTNFDLNYNHWFSKTFETKLNDNIKNIDIWIKSNIKHYKFIPKFIIRLIYKIKIIRLVSWFNYEIYEFWKLKRSKLILFK